MHNAARTLYLFHHGIFIQDRFLTFGIKPGRQISEGAIIAGSPNPPHASRPEPRWAKVKWFYLNRRGANTYRLLLQVCHSCEVPGEI
jgi:hypothetical protein